MPVLRWSKGKNGKDRGKNVNLSISKAHQEHCLHHPEPILRLACFRLVQSTSLTDRALNSAEEHFPMGRKDEATLTERI